MSALYAIMPNFPPGKMPGMPEFENKFYVMSHDEDGPVEGPWNTGPKWEQVAEGQDQEAVDGGDGTASVKLSNKDQTLVQAAARQTQSNTEIDPTTGAELGSGKVAGDEA